MKFCTQTHEKLPAHIRSTIRSLFKMGWMPAAIAELAGVTETQARTVLSDAGLVAGSRNSVLDGYEPPEPEAEGLTPSQRWERERSRKAAFALFVETKMTAAIARRIYHSSDVEMEAVLELDADDLAVVRRSARNHWERLKRLEAENVLS